MISIFEPIPITDRLLRRAVFVAFGGKCFYSGRDVSFDEMHIDHIRPKSKGGQDCISNYALCCQEINFRKNGKHSDSFEQVVTEVVKLLFATKVASVLDDLRMNGQFVRPNDWLRDKGIAEKSPRWHRLRYAMKTQRLHSVSRVLDGKSRGIVLYCLEDLERLLADDS